MQPTLPNALNSVLSFAYHLNITFLDALLFYNLTFNNYRNAIRISAGISQLDKFIRTSVLLHKVSDNAKVVTYFNQLLLQ